MPDVETLKLVVGPLGAVVVLCIVAWKQHGDIVSYRAELKQLNEVVIGLVRDQTRAQMEDAAAARELAASVRATGRTAT
jgi:hypothetical protein